MNTLPVVRRTAGAVLMMAWVAGFAPPGLIADDSDGDIVATIPAIGEKATEEAEIAILLGWHLEATRRYRSIP